MKIAIIFLIVQFCVYVTSEHTEVVDTENGQVRGKILKTVISGLQYSAFKGIPYAEPPLGHLRFRPPVPKGRWSGVLSTSVEGANCVQKDFVYRVITGSEDCLYLNVYTPRTTGLSHGQNLKPVMVWIHGGTFKSGYGNSSLYGPDFLLENDVVVVTVNYRLGPLGFLSLHHDNATGNAALKDQNLALRWVQKNIRSFGGDPDSVTLFGQSAGGVAVDLHALSPMSKGLYHRSISMSASPLCPWSFGTPNDVEKQTFKLLESLGKKTKDKNEALTYLYELPAEDLVKAAEALGSSNPPFRPTIERSNIALDEEKFLTECPYEKYLRGDFAKVPHLTGFTKHETLLFADGLVNLMGLEKQNSEATKKVSSSVPLWGAIKNKFAKVKESVSTSAVMELIEDSSNILFIQGIDSKQKLMDKSGTHPIYYYEFSYETRESLHTLLYNISLPGVAHGDDFAYLFHMTVTNLPLDPNDPTYITRLRMAKMWSNFAKYNNPTPVKDELLQNIQWPVSGSAGYALDFGRDLKVLNKRPTDKMVQVFELANGMVYNRQTGCNEVSGRAGILSRLIL